MVASSQQTANSLWEAAHWNPLNRRRTMFRFFLLHVLVALALQPLASIVAAQEVAAVQGQSTVAQDQKDKSIVEIVRNLEEADYAPIVDVSYDDGVWEVEAYKADIPYELSLDPQTGEVISEHRDDADAKPPAKSLLLSTIIEGIEKAGYTDLDDISFEHRTWEAEVRRNGQKRELRVDPATGEVVSDRVDD
jgi:uncharacterized membrane protein YkoI